jgi:hypothetical protein
MGSIFMQQSLPELQTRFETRRAAANHSVALETSRRYPSPLIRWILIGAPGRQHMECAAIQETVDGDKTTRINRRRKNVIPTLARSPTASASGVKSEQRILPAGKGKRAPAFA